MDYNDNLIGDQIAQFYEAIRASGLEPPVINELNKFYRFPGSGKNSRNTAAWCKVFPDGLGGIFGDYSSGLSESWHINDKGRLTKTERKIFEKHVSEAKKQAIVEREAMHAEAKVRANNIWMSSTPAPESHLYIVRKNIKSSYFRLYSGDLKINGMQCDNSIIVPVCSHDEIVSLQFINQSGKKRFLSGGRITGCYAVLGSNQLPTRGQLILAEGAATCATIHESTGHSVIVAFNANNLEAVARNICSKLPLSVELIIACDNDRHTIGNPGMTYGRKAAVNSGALLVWPEFLCADCNCSDFNDAKNCPRMQRRAS